jgi:APA family basic amino acid/polyamine antiporter
MALVRAIGRWALTGLMINCTIGGSIFALPGELARLAGTASPLAFLAGGLIVAVLIACASEVASQFPEPGGAYVYVRRAFGRFAGLQAAWFYLLIVLGGVAAIANVFVSYLAVMVPVLAERWLHAVAVAAVIAVPTTINCLGVRSGAALSNLFAVAKLLPLALLIVLGLEHSLAHPIPIFRPEPTAPDPSAWFKVLLAVFFAYDGWEDVLVPSGEVKDPRRSLPFALTVGMFVTVTVYTLIQYVTVATIGTASASDHPLADVAGRVMGDAGRVLVSAGAMISTYGYIVAAIATAPRLPYALASAGEAPPVLANVHRRFHTPVYAIVTFALLSWVLAATGTFFWALELAAGSAAVISGSVCASLIRLRHTHPHATAWRVPFGTAVAIIGLVVCAILLAQLDVRHALLMLLTVSIATANWAWAMRQPPAGHPLSSV